jgi:hypothetical protein
MSFFGDEVGNAQATGGSLHRGTAQFAAEHLGGEGAKVVKSKVAVMAFEDILQSIQKRKLPSLDQLPEGAAPAAVVMKLDIEGGEYDVLHKARETGLICDTVDEIMIEWHPSDGLGLNYSDIVNHSTMSTIVRNNGKKCRLHYNNEDDEKYATDGKPLPPPRKHISSPS